MTFHLLLFTIQQKLPSISTGGTEQHEIVLLLLQQAKQLSESCVSTEPQLLAEINLYLIKVCYFMKSPLPNLYQSDLFTERLILIVLTPPCNKAWQNGVEFLKKVVIPPC